MKKPWIVCHMLSSVNGRIDGSSLRDVTVVDDYEATGQALRYDAWLCGRTTMEQHFAEKEPFVSSAGRPAGKPEVHVARQAKSYAVSMDTHGKLRWATADLDGDHLIVAVCEQAPADYLAQLRDQGISYIVAGEREIDLRQTVEWLAERFGIGRLAVEGGGHINGAFLNAGLLDEISLLLVPGVDARPSVPTTFDDESFPAVATQLKLKSVEQRAGDTLWLRYDVVPTSGGTGASAQAGS